jgi:hypothetical protein
MLIVLRELAELGREISTRATPGATKIQQYLPSVHPPPSRSLRRTSLSSLSLTLPLTLTLTLTPGANKTVGNVDGNVDAPACFEGSLR